MPFKIVRGDITKMNTEAIVNIVNNYPTAETGCDSVVYKAAGYRELLEYRERNVGFVPEGKVFITPGFKLQAKYIIHAVSPHYTNGNHREEKRLRSCYEKSLQLARKNGIKSISFPLIPSGGFDYPKEEGMRIAVDEIRKFLTSNEMDIFLVVFDTETAHLGAKVYPDLKTYIDCNYVEAEYRSAGRNFSACAMAYNERAAEEPCASVPPKPSLLDSVFKKKQSEPPLKQKSSMAYAMPREAACPDIYFDEEHESKLKERMKHMSDTYSEYLMYLIQERQLENAEVWKRAIVDKKVFSKIKNNANYHPNKLTALCLCIGAKLNLDETKDLLARAGYALSPCDKTDIIFSYFIENKIYDMIELDIQLEEHGLPCIIS